MGGFTLYNIEQQSKFGDLHFTILNNKAKGGFTLYNIEQQSKWGDLHFTVLNNKANGGIYTGLGMRSFQKNTMFCVLFGFISHSKMTNLAKKRM